MLVPRSRRWRFGRRAETLQRDKLGNTPLLLAYVSLNGVVAVELIRRGALLPTKNLAGVGVLDSFPPDLPPEAAEQRTAIRRKLLELTDREPEWLDGPHCQICNTKFTLQIRKHHCRHCGRVACSKCAPKDRKLPLPKFKLDKPERLCELCYDALSPVNAAS